MTVRSLVIGAAVVAVLGPVTAEALSAQAPPPARPPSTETELVFQREVFQYPAFTRRNPFRPLLGADGGGPRFEQLSLIGIVYSSDPAASVAVVTTGGVAIAADGTMTPIDGDASYLKVGQRLGNSTVVEIRRDAVVFDVEVFDAVERQTMTFVSRRQGGTP
jgi:hypothetical protein